MNAIEIVFSIYSMIAIALALAIFKKINADNKRIAKRMLKGVKQLERVEHGKWIKTSKNLSACSSCGNCILSEYTEDYFFCPNCGADMR